LAFEHLQSSLTRGNLWLYVLAELERQDASPGEIRKRVEGKHGFAPATITFYSVIYRLRREGLVKRSSEEFRSSYSITPKGRAELAKALDYIGSVRNGLGSS
jgi:PadR family transcriptional regulator, regulatory protein PadR